MRKAPARVSPPPCALRKSSGRCRRSRNGRPRQGSGARPRRLRVRAGRSAPCLPCRGTERRGCPGRSGRGRAPPPRSPGARLRRGARPGRGRGALVESSRSRRGSGARPRRARGCGGGACGAVGGRARRQGCPLGGRGGQRWLSKERAAAARLAMEDEAWPRPLRSASHACRSSVLASAGDRPR